jgi:LPXTG-motif cell wall-anchored protein
MDSVTLIRVIAGALAVVVLFIIIWRRKRKIVE